jgi:hypothetical protein
VRPGVAQSDPAYSRRCLLAGQTIYDQANTHPRGPLLTTSPHAYYNEPFGLANPATNLDTVAHALGYAVQARMYDELSSTSTFAGFAQSQLDWVLGANAWGSFAEPSACDHRYGSASIVAVPGTLPSETSRRGASGLCLR